MLETLLGISTVVKTLRLRNALRPIVVTVLGMVKLSKALSSANVNCSMVVKPALVGRVRLSALLQPWNALCLMVETLSGMVMLVKPQPWNALVPMLVTLSGMVMLVRPAQK